MTALTRVTDALAERGMRGRGPSWQCPGHEDRSPSLSVRQGDTGVVLHCHAGCETGDVVAALGLAMSDLFDEPQHHESRERNRTFMPRRKVAEYPYCDENGELLFVVERWEPGKNGRKKDFLRRAADGTYSTQGIRNVVYRLPEVVAQAQAGGIVCVVEGEKDVDNLAAAGAVATCNPGGAGKWRDEYSASLVGAAEVVVIADRDDTGRQHAAQVAESLRRAGVPARVVEPAAGKDVTDHLDAGLGFDDLVTPETRPANPAIPGPSHPANGEVVSGISGTRSGVDGWDDPVPLDARPLPAFPVGRMGHLGAFVEAAATSLQVPDDLMAFACFAAISTATGGRCVVRIKPGWTETTALYLAALADSSEKKTPALNLAALPLREVETELIERCRPEIEARAQEIRITQAQMTKAEQKAASDKPEAALADAEAARIKLLDLGEVAELPRLLVRDVTLEALAKVMHAQGGRIGMLASEGGILKVAAGLYSSNGRANTDLLLEAFSGGPYTIDRTGRPSSRMPTTFLAVGLIVQPGVLAGVEKKNPEFRENGLLGRFLYARPAPTGTDSFHAPDIPAGVHNDYDRRIRALVEALWSRPEPTRLTLAPDAVALFADYYDAFAPRRQPGGDLHDVADWAGKFRGQLVRIAACLTLYENPHAAQITRERMADVIAMAPYFIAHAQAAFDLMSADSDGHLGPLRDILAWARSRPNPAAPFSARDVWQALKGRRWARDMEDLTAALDDLEDYGWIALMPPPDRAPGTRGRKPSPKYDVHPWVYAPPKESK